MLSGSRSNVAVKVFGDDLYRLRSLGEQVRRVMAEVPGVVDLATEPQVDIPIVEIKFDRAAIARHGLTVEEVSEAVEAAFRGLVVSRVLEGRYAFDLVLRLGDPTTTDWEAIRNLPVDTPSGAKLPLRALARIGPSTGPNQISREDVQRKFVVTCNVAGRDLAGVVEDIRRRVAERVPIGEGAVPGLPRRVRRPVRERRGDDPAADAPGPGGGAGDRPAVAGGLRLGAGRPAGDGQPAAGAGRRRAGRPPDGRGGDGRVADRVHHGAGDRHPQRDHARLARPAPAGPGGRGGPAVRRSSGGRWSGWPRS